MTLTLRKKTFLPLAVLSALFFLYLYGHYSPSSLRNLEQNELRGAERHLDTVGEGLIPLLLAHQLDTVYENLDALLRQNKEWIGIRLVDPDGRLLYPLQETANPAPLGKGVRVVERRISYLGNTLGKLALKIDISARTADAKARHNQLATVLLVVFCGYLLSIWIIVERVVRRPVNVLAHAAERVAHGEFNAPLEKTGNDEVGTLVDSFAGMRDAICDYQATMLASDRAVHRLSQAVEQSPVAIMITDTEARLTFVNPKFSQMTGYRPEEVMGENPRLFKSGRTTAAEYELLWRTLKAGGIWYGELCNKKKSGELYWESASISPILDENGAVVSYLGVMEDITERKLAEEELRRLKDELEMRVQERTAQLAAKNQELERMNKLFIGRELKMIELKERIKELEKQVAVRPSADGSSG